MVYILIWTNLQDLLVSEKCIEHWVEFNLLEVFKDYKYMFIYIYTRI